MQVKSVCDALRRKLLPKAPRDDWGSATEKMCQLLEEFEKEFGKETIELEVAVSVKPPRK